MVTPAASSGSGPVPGWVFDGAATGDERYWERGSQLLRRLPDVVIGVEADRNQVSVFWRERVAVEQIDSMLDDLAEALQGLSEWQWESEQEALARLSEPSPESE